MVWVIAKADNQRPVLLVKAETRAAAENVVWQFEGWHIIGMIIDNDFIKVEEDAVCYLQGK